jgi:membrane protease YdiL (CAAX protease family)
MMKPLRIRKFFLDYLLGSGLIILMFYLSIGNFTIMDTQGVLTLAQSCSSQHSEKDILQNAQLAIRSGEHCELVSPCDGLRVLRCEGTLQVSELPRSFFFRDLVIFRVKNSIEDKYQFASYRDSSAFRVPTGLIVMALTYGLILVEAGALLFALGRQDKLRQSFSLPEGSKANQFFRPLLFAVLLAVIVVVMNYQLFALFDHPAVENREMIRNLFKTGSGLLFVIVFAPLAEELIFRGVVLRFFVERNQVKMGTVLVSLLFSVLHGLHEESLGWQLYKSSLYFIISVVLCRLYITQKNLWSPIVFHSAFNATMVALFNLFV